MKKRVLSLFMVLALCLSMTPTVSFAEETGAVTEQEAQSGESIIDDTTDVYTTGNDVSGGDVSGGDADAQDAEKDAAVQAAQALIDALPDEVTAENADELQAQLIAIDEALAALDEAQTAKLDMTRYEAICAVLTTFVAAQDGGHSHTICGATTCNGHEAGSSHNVVKDWIPLSFDASTGKLYKGGDVWEMDAQPSYKLEEGYYYLETDIEIPSYTPLGDNLNLPSIRIDGNVSLCLNGHSITQDNGVSAISIPNGSTNILSLCDCVNDESSYITAGASDGVFFGTSSFNMYGGIIKDFSGAGVNGFGTFNMYGGTITGNATGVVVGGTALEAPSICMAVRLPATALTRAAVYMLITVLLPCQAVRSTATTLTQAVVYMLLTVLLPCQAVRLPATALARAAVYMLLTVLLPCQAVRSPATILQILQ